MNNNSERILICYLQVMLEIPTSMNVSYDDAISRSRQKKIDFSNVQLAQINSYMVKKIYKLALFLNFCTNNSCIYIKQK